MPSRKEEFVRKRDDYFPPLTFGMDPDVVLLFRIFPFTTFEIFKWRARTYFPSTFFGMDPKFSFLFSFGLAPTPTLIFFKILGWPRKLKNGDRFCGDETSPAVWDKWTSFAGTSTNFGCTFFLWFTITKDGSIFLRNFDMICFPARVTWRSKCKQTRMIFPEYWLLFKFCGDGDNKRARIFPYTTIQVFGMLPILIYSSRFWDWPRKLKNGDKFCGDETSPAVWDK